jgi:hypothetical protein
VFHLRKSSQHLASAHFRSFRWCVSTVCSSFHRLCLSFWVASSSAATRASMSSISIALAAWLKTLSAARRRQDGGELASTMIFSSVDEAALVACWSRAMDCPYASRRACRYAASNSGSFIHRRSVLGTIPIDFAASSTLRWVSRAGHGSYREKHRRDTDAHHQLQVLSSTSYCCLTIFGSFG